jgi:hypothetical protein
VHVRAGSPSAVRSPRAGACAATVVALAFGLSHCALKGFERGGPSSGTGGGGGEAPSCALALPPPPPGVADSGESLEVVVALRTLRLLDDGSDTLGFDLDGLCSCSDGAPPSCVPDEGAASLMSYCDAAGGRDRAMSSLFALLSGAMLIEEPNSFFSQAADRGEWSLLVRVVGYNGLADDPEVTVALYAVSTPTGLSGRAWDGSDAWPVSDDSVGDDENGVPTLDKPRFVDPSAHVTGGVLVARPTAGEMRLAGPDARMALSFERALLSGRLEPDARGSFALRAATLAAVVPVDELFAIYGSVRRIDGAPLCSDDPDHDAARTALCRAPDLRLAPGGPASPCDGISLAIGFDAEPARLGAVMASEAPTESCAPGVDPSAERCL